MIAERSSHTQVICVSENGSIRRWLVRIHLGAKNLSIYLDGMTSSRHIVSNARYTARIPMLFIVMIHFSNKKSQQIKISNYGIMLKKTVFSETPFLVYTRNSLLW